MADIRYMKRPTGIEKIRQDALDLVEKYGWSVMHIFGDEDTPGFSYTVGLARKKKPDLIVFGLPPSTAQPIMNRLAEKVLAGLPLSDGLQLNDLFAGAPASLRSVPPHIANEYLRMSFSLFHDAVTCMQLVWPDESGKFPWESGFNEKHRAAQLALYNVH